MKKRVLCVIVALLILAGFLSFVAEAATYRQGSSGSVVRQIQTRLKNWGYYTGSVDGIYGSKTVAAVKYFQRKNGLAVDGICGPKTLAAIGINAGSSSSKSSTSSNIELLARLIAAEARGESYTGQIAVGAVVMNRIKNPSFPSTISGVIYQKGAFTCIDDGQFNSVAVEDHHRKAAQAAISGNDPTGGAIYYYNPVTATNKWIRSRPVLVTIGKHVFCA